MQEEKFSWFVPVDIVEKAGEEKDADGLPKRLLIGGVASNSNTGFDVDGQLLKVDGFDYKPLLQKGYLNLEHGYSKTKDASLIVGVPTNAFVKDGEFHVEGELFKDNPKAVAMYKLGQTLKKSGSSRRIGYSVEGHPTEFDPLDKRIIKSAKITGLALTLSPKCSGTHLFVKGGEIEYETQEGSEYLVDIIQDGERVVVDRELNILKGEEIDQLEKGGEGSRGGRVIGHTKSGKPVYSHKYAKEYNDFSKQDHKEAATIHKEKYLSINEKKFPAAHDHHMEVSMNHSAYGSENFDSDSGTFKKAMQAGSVTGRETTDQAMTGEPLKQESLDGVPKKKKDYGKLLSQMRKRKGEDFSKAEVFTYLIDAHSMDVDSCKNFWMLTAQIQKSLNSGIEI